MKPVRFNSATNNRPHGERIIDASLLMTDLAKTGLELENEKAWVEGDRNAMTIFKSDPLTIVLSLLKTGSIIVDKEVDAFLIVQVLDGSVDVNTQEETLNVNKGQMVVVHNNVIHSIEARMQSSLLLITSQYPVQKPPRENKVL